MGKGTPDAPDYAGAAQQQAQSSREVTEQQTWANRPTQNTPFGSTSWQVTPTWDESTGQYLNSWTQNTDLTPEAQDALDSQLNVQRDRSHLAESLTGRMANEYGQAMDWDQFDQMAGTPDKQNLQMNVDGSAPYYQKAEDAMYGKWSARQEPRMAQDKEALRTQLYNTGLKEGDAAYDKAMTELEQNQNDAREQANFSAITGSGAEAQRMQGMDVSAGSFANNAANQAMGQDYQAANYQNSMRQQQIAEQMQQRGFSLNEINAILNGQQVGMPSMPSFQGASRSEGTQSLSAAQMQGQHDLDVFNAQQQATQGALSGVGSMAMMFSDIRLKKNIYPIYSQREDKLPEYIFDYIWEDDFEGRHIGFMAHEVEKLYPEAVFTTPSGYKMVNYGSL